MRYTDNLLLKLPDLTDYVSIGDLNENFEKIDEEIATINDPSTGVGAKLTQHLAEKASGASVGHVKIGKNVSVTDDGVISIPDASQSTMGVMRAGDGLTVSNGVVSAYMQMITDKLVTNTPANYPLGKSVMFITPTAIGAEGWRSSLGLSGSYYLLVETTKTTTSNGIQRVTAYLLATTAETPRIFERNATNSGYGPFIEITAKASTSQPGGVQLSSAVTSTDETKAATPKAVKTAMDRANEAFTLASNGKTTVKNAITGVDPTVVIPNEPTFNDLANAIGQIRTGKKQAGGTYTATANTFSAEVRGLDFKPSIVITKGYDASSGGNAIYFYNSNMTLSNNSVIMLGASFRFTSGTVSNPIQVPIADGLDSRFFVDGFLSLHPQNTSNRVVEWLAYE